MKIRRVPKYSQIGDLLYFYGPIIYLFSQIADGPIRYFLGLFGGVGLIYLRDVIIIIIIISSIGKTFMSGRISVIIMLTIIITMFYSIVSVSYIGSIPVMLFSYKTIIPFLAGLVCFKYVFTDMERLCRIFNYLFILAIFGIFIDYFVDLPWSGFSYDLVGVSIEGNVKSNTMGIDRLLGFGRSNIESASQIYVMAVFLLSIRWRGWFALMLWLVTGVAIVLTTAKSVIVIYILATLFWIAFKLLPSAHKFYRGLLIFPVATMVALPLLSLDFVVDPADPVSVGLFASLSDRIINAWPSVFQIVQDRGHPFFGLGIGGTGSGMLYFQPDLNTTADNMFVYFYAWFGIPAAAIPILTYSYSQKLDIRKFHADMAYYHWILFIMLMGITANIIESPISSMVYAFILSYLTGGRKVILGTATSPVAKMGSPLQQMG